MKYLFLVILIILLFGSKLYDPIHFYEPKPIKIIRIDNIIYGRKSYTKLK